MDLKYALLSVCMVLRISDTGEQNQRIVTVDLVETNGRCCNKYCMDVESEAECNEWKESILRDNAQNGELTDDRIFKMEETAQNIRDMRKKAKSDREVQLQLLRQKINETFQVRTVELKRTLNESLNKVAQECQRIKNQTSISDEQGEKIVYPADCQNVTQEYAKVWNGTGGIFDVYPDSKNESIEVFCDLTTDGGGWTVFQRRMDGSVDFYRNWTSYLNGFGDADKEMWLGLEKIHRLVKEGEYELRVDLADWDGATAYAKYSTFSLADASDYYRLSVGNFSGDAGDSLEYHSGSRFSTYDEEHSCTSKNCSQDRRGAWWYDCCSYSNLNGIYYQGGSYEAEHADGVVWYYWRNRFQYSYKFSEMKFRRKV